MECLLNRKGLKTSRNVGLWVSIWFVPLLAFLAVRTRNVRDVGDRLLVVRRLRFTVSTDRLMDSILGGKPRRFSALA